MKKSLKSATIVKQVSVGKLTRLHYDYYHQSVSAVLEKSNLLWVLLKQVHLTNICYLKSKLNTCITKTYPRATEEVNWTVLPTGQSIQCVCVRVCVCTWGISLLFVSRKLWNGLNITGNKNKARLGSVLEFWINFSCVILLEWHKGFLWMAFP